MSEPSNIPEPSDGGSDQRLVQPWWLGADFDPNEASDECVRCHCSMSMKDGREPQDNPELNVCDPCAQDLVAEMWSRLNRLL